jgi:sugar/nucleoside kinase (ribokinase family)
MAIYETALPRQLRRKALREAISNARAILVDANLPEAALRAVAERAVGPIFAIAISPAKAPRLTAIASRIHTIFMNIREAKALTGHDDARQRLDGLAALGFSRAVITDGSRAVLVLDGEACQAVIPPSAAKVADVTGAGDALAGATLAALSKDNNTGLADAVRSGVAAAQLTLRVEGPIAQALTGAEFDAIRAATTIRELETLEKEANA